MSIEQAWLADQAERPSTCVLVDRFASEPVAGIARLRIASADALVGELVRRLGRNFRFPNRNPVVAAFEDAYFDRAEPVAVGTVGGDVLTFVSADPRARVLTADDGYTVTGDALATIAVYALLPDIAPVERSPDIYAPTVRHEADPSEGAPLDVAWHGSWQIGGPTFCLHVPGADAREIERIPYRAELPAPEIASILTRAFAEEERFACSASVRVGDHQGHSITLLGLDAERARFHDPWPDGSLLREARRDEEGTWSVGADEFRRCLHAVFVSPEVLARQQGREFRRTLREVLAGDLAFFNIRETGRTRRGEVWEVEAQPGGFKEHVHMRFAVGDKDWLEATLLGLDRTWLGGADRPFAIDILRSVLGAVVSPLDAPEAALAIQAVRAVIYGAKAVEEALGSGAPHLLGQARAFVLAVLGAQESALLTFAFSRVVAVNAGGLVVGIERAGRTAGPFLTGTELPVPWRN